MSWQAEISPHYAEVNRQYSEYHIYDRKVFWLFYISCMYVYCSFAPCGLLMGPQTKAAALI